MTFEEQFPELKDKLQGLAYDQYDGTSWMTKDKDMWSDKEYLYLLLGDIVTNCLSKQRVMEAIDKCFSKCMPECKPNENPMKGCSVCNLKKELGL